jgi:hypothetical protein
MQLGGLGGNLQEAKVWQDIYAQRPWWPQQGLRLVTWPVLCSSVPMQASPLRDA